MEFLKCLVAFHFLLKVYRIVQVLALGAGPRLLEHFTLLFADHIGS